ncbi:MAG TPA: hypothetical protein VKI44_28680 [Acetobacteraceae bacterium]|nr:hypothetical protein [Acetobacteraceae bacterium]
MIAAAETTAEGTKVCRTKFGSTLALVAVTTSAAVPLAAAETRAVSNGLEVHETALILHAEMPTHMLTNESCANAQTGWTIVPESVKTEVVTARMMDPGGDPDWKVEKAEGRTRLDNGNTRICLWGYCQGPLQFQCEIQVRASWQERN